MSRMLIFFFLIAFTYYLQLEYSFRITPITNLRKFQSFNLLYATNDKSRVNTNGAYSDAVTWYDIDECSVLIPSQERIPKAIIHFIGGFLAGSSIQIGYSSILSELCANGFLIIATPIPPIEIDHMKVSNLASELFVKCYSSSIRPILGKAANDVPVIGLSHSLGGKLTALINSNVSLRKVLPKRYANIYLAFNNYGIQESIQSSTNTASPEVKKIVETFQSANIQDFIQNAIKISSKGNPLDSSTSTAASTFSNAANEFMNSFARTNNNNNNNNNSNNNNPMQPISELSDYIRSSAKDFTKEKLSLEFNPSPAETWQMILKSYNINKNYVFKFEKDDIDQSLPLSEYLLKRGCEVKLITLPGNHLTPNAIIVSPETVASTSQFFRGSNLEDTISQDTQRRLQEEQKIAISFIKELIKLLNMISNNAWDDVITRDKEKYNLPSKSKDAIGTDNSSSRKWDSDNY